jgi:Protein of unknown function (DUF2631)
VAFPDPHSEPPDLGAPEDYVADHPDEHPSDWGWHGDWGRTGRVGAWVAVIVLLLMTTTTHYNGSGAAWLIFFAACIIVYQIWDIRRRKNAWRQ